MRDPSGRGWSDSARSMALTLAGLYIAGAAIGAMTLLLPHPPASDDPALWSNVGLAAVASVALAAAAGRLSPLMLQIAVGVGTLVVTRAVFYSHDPGSFYSLWYVWVGLYTFFFFGRRWGAVHMGVIGIAYAWVLTEIHQTSPLSRWVMTVGTIAIAGILIDVLAGRVRQRADDADARARSLAAMSSVAHELARSTTPETAAPAVCQAAVDVASADSATLWEPSSDGSGLIAVASTDPQMKGRTLIFVSQPSKVLLAFTSGEPTFVAEPGPSERPGGIRPQTPADTGSALFQPVSREGTPIGVLAVNWSERIEELPEEMRRAFDLLSVEAAIAIERAETLARLERVARTDDLTGLPNRRAWDEHLSRELARARRDASPLSVAILDLDHFKTYNDLFGHQAGDRLLKEAAAQWQGLIRQTDVLARYGGEEFALALPGAGIDDARLLVERLRVATPRDERSSAGVVAWDGDEGEAGLVARADAALYAAKRRGRDRIVVA